MLKRASVPRSLTRAFSVKEWIDPGFIRAGLCAVTFVLAGCSAPEESTLVMTKVEAEPARGLVVKVEDDPVEMNDGSQSSMQTVPGPFLDAAELSWKVNEFDASRWKTLVGGIEGGQIDRHDIQFGVWELAPLAIYHLHRHEVPEIYFITDGRALWTVGDETREVTAGMTIYSKPGAVHKMVNLTDEPVKAIWVWWAPDGDTSVFAGDYEFTEPAPEQPEGAGFKPGDNLRLY